MANLRDIKKRINSVTSTKQITRTMEMVATAKIRKASERLTAAEPYSNAMLEMLAGVSSATEAGEFPLLDEHEEIQHAIIIVIASDRGLAGGFNSTVLHAAERRIAEYEARGIATELIFAGKKAASYFTYRGREAALSYSDLSADPTMAQAREIASYISEKYVTGETDEVVVIYNHARNAAEQDLHQETILPIDPSKFVTEDGEEVEESEFIFEPSAAAVLETLLPVYVVTMVYHALIDSAAAEQGARRRAMKSATDNATEIIATLQRSYNRARQDAITTEITEIVGGAAALEG